MARTPFEPVPPLSLSLSFVHVSSISRLGYFLFLFPSAIIKAREGILIKCISGDGAKELVRSVKHQRVLDDRGIRWRSSPPGIAERAIRQMMKIGYSQLVKGVCGQDNWLFTVADTAFKIAPMPDEYLRGETP